MNISFLHLSDIHSDGKESLVNIKLSRISDALREFSSIDEMILICSGDLANTGQQCEYEKFNIFLETLNTKVKKETGVKKVHMLVIPGNHDLKFNGDDRVCADILKYQENNMLDSKFSNELEMMENFKNYAQSQGCFILELIHDTKIFNFNGFSIQVNLLNTAPFSTKKNDNKELHYLPEESINSLIKQDNIDLAITIMHHSPEWFEWKSKKLLETTIRDHTEILFMGHDHDVETINITSQPDDTTILCKGGLYSGNINRKSTFSISTLNTETCNFRQKIFEWNKQHCIFSSDLPEVNKTIIPKTKKIKVKDTFISELLADKQNLAEYSTDYFVFPSIKQRNESTIAEKSKIVSEDDFFRLLNTIPLISVIGKNNAGKTTVLKYLYLKSIKKGYFPLFMGVENYRRNRNVNKIIKDLFEEQYSENSVDFTRYKQLKKSERIIIIDDFDYIEQSSIREALIKNLNTEMGCVIISSKESFNFDLTDAAKKILENETQIVELLISDFFKAKRAELIKKICETDKRLCLSDVEDISKIIDFHVLKKHELFNLSPEFIIQCVKYFMGLDKRERRNEAVFNVIFETNIRNSVIENADIIDVQNFLISLEEIAFYMHFHKTERVTTDEIESIINDYNKKYTLKINAKNFVDVVKNAKILNGCVNSFEYQFCSRNHLAYFVANKINKLINKKGPDVIELSYIIDNICFGINDTILLFLSYLRNNTNFALTLCEKAESLLFNLEEIDFDLSNIQFIKGENKSKVSLPTKLEKSEYKQYVGEMEKERREQDELEVRYKGLYDYDENDIDKLQYKLARALKYTEIIAKSLNSQFSILEADEKIRIVDCLYRFPNKILYAVLKRAEDKYDQIILELKEHFDSLDLERKPNEDELKRVVNDLSIALCLSLYDNLAFCSANSATMSVLDSYNFTNSNYSIMNLLMQENGTSTNEFVNKAYKLAQESDNEFLHHLIKMVVRKHVITHDEINYKQLDKLATPIDINGKSRSLFDKKQLLLITGSISAEYEQE